MIKRDRQGLHSEQPLRVRHASQSQHLQGLRKHGTGEHYGRLRMIDVEPVPGLRPTTHGRPRGDLHLVQG